MKLQDFMCSYQCKEILHSTSALLLVSVVFKNIFTLVLAQYPLLKKQQTFLCISETKNLILIPGHSSKIIHLESYIVETFLSFTNSLRCVSFSKFSDKNSSNDIEKVGGKRRHGTDIDSKG